MHIPHAALQTCAPSLHGLLLQPHSTRALLTMALLTMTLLTMLPAVLTMALLTMALLAMALLTIAVLTVAVLTMALLTMALLTVALLTMAILTMAILTMAILTMAMLTIARQLYFSSMAWPNSPCVYLLWQVACSGCTYYDRWRAFRRRTARGTRRAALRRRKRSCGPRSAHSKYSRRSQGHSK